MKIMFLQELTGGLFGRLLKGLLKPRLNRLFTRTPVLAALLLTAVVTACGGGGSGGGGGGGGGGGSTIPTSPKANCVFAEDNGTKDCGLIALPQVFDYAATYNITVGKETTIGFGELGVSNFTFTQIINGNISDPKSVPSPVSNNNQLMLLASATALNLNISGIANNVFGEFYIDLDLVLVNNSKTTVKVKVHYTISITPVNDAPVFSAVRGSESQFDTTATHASYTFANIPFNSTAGYSVGNVSAIDDADNDTISYSISGGTNVTKLFQINSATGEITLKDMATNSGDLPIPYTFNVTASDRKKDGSVTTEITVSVLPNNQAPVFLPVSGAKMQFTPAAGATPVHYSFDGILHNSPTGHSVGNVSANDDDGDDITYTIGNEYIRNNDTPVNNDLFQINSSGGITLERGATANDLGRYTFNVTASDDRDASTTATISVTVIDGTPPVFVGAPYEFDLPLAAGVVVGNVSAVDAEETLFNYSLAGSGDLFDDLFEPAAADNADGTRNIILSRAVTIDDLAEFPVTFQIVATHQIGELSSEANITVTSDTDGDRVINLYDAFPDDGANIVNGDGNFSHPYIISNIYQLQAIAGVDHTGTALDSSTFTNNSFLYGTNAADQLTKHYILANNINAADTAVWAKPTVGSNNFIGHGWTPIAGGENQVFSGSFTGDGYHIHNLNMNLQVANSKDTFGLFGTNGGNISAVGLTNINMQIAAINGSFINDTSLAGNGETESYTLGSGALVGTNNEGGSIKYAYSTGIVNVEGLYTGGLVGVNIGNITYSYSGVSVTGRRYTGGLVGVFGVPVTTSAEVASSYATGNVTATGDTVAIRAGGLVGGLAQKNSMHSAKISASYAGNNGDNDVVSVKGGNNERAGPLIGTYFNGYHLDVSYSHWTNSTTEADGGNELVFHSAHSGLGTFTFLLVGRDNRYLLLTQLENTPLNGDGGAIFTSPHWDPNFDDPGIERGWIFEDGEFPALYANRTLSSVTTSLMPPLEAQVCHRRQASDACGTYDAAE